jgi:Ca2+-binding RTX toxin-like protein
MAVYLNQSGARFVLPNGTDVESGGTIDLDAATASIAGVAQMIEAGKLVAQGKRGRPPKAADDTITGGDGNDTIDTGDGNDTVDGGNDTIVAGA